MLVLCCASIIGRGRTSSSVVRKTSYIGSSSSKASSDTIDKYESKKTWTGSQDHPVLHLLQYAAIIALKESSAIEVIQKEYRYV